MKKEYMAPLAEILEFKIDKTICDVGGISTPDPDNGGYNEGWV